MILREIVRALERLEEGQREMLERLGEMETPHPSPSAARSIHEFQICPEGDYKSLNGAPQGEGLKVREDDWIQNGIDNILGYEAGKKKKEE